MNKQEFVSSVVSHYLKGYNQLVFVDTNFKLFGFHLHNGMKMESIERMYEVFNKEIELNHYEFF